MYKAKRSEGKKKKSEPKDDGGSPHGFVARRTPQERLSFLVQSPPAVLHLSQKCVASRVSNSLELTRKKQRARSSQASRNEKRVFHMVDRRISGTVSTVINFIQLDEEI